MVEHSETPRQTLWASVILSLCFVLSGCVGLVYEVVCGTLLGQIIGGTSTTHAAVLAFFMAGLALGNRLGGRWADRTTAPWLLYGSLEAAIGFLVVMGLPIVGFAGGVYANLAPQPGGALAWLDPALRWGLAACVVVPPATLMGATLPILVRTTTRSMTTLGASVGWLYFVNSVGAMGGALLAGFVLVPRFGLELSLIFAGGANLLMAAGVYGAGRLVWGQNWGTGQVVSSAVAEGGRVYSDTEARCALGAVCLSGVAAMGLEVAWTRTLVLTLGGTAPAFSLMLATFIGGIAFGGLIAAWLSRGDRDAFGPLLGALTVAGCSLAISVPFYDRLPVLFHQFGYAIPKEVANYSSFVGLTGLVAIAVMAIPTLALGAAVPLASRVVSRQLAHAGQSVGRVFSVNTLGNVVGAIGVGVVLLPYVDIEGVFVAGILVLAAAVAWAAQANGRRLWLLASLVMVAGVIVAPRWDPLLKMAGLYRFLDQDIKGLEGFRKDTKGIKVLFEGDDAEVSVGVIETGTGDRVLRVNGKSDAGTKGDVPTQVLLGQLPSLFHPNPKRALVVGLGSGMTVGSLLSHPSIERIDVVEISPKIVEASRFFDKWTGAPLNDPRVRLHVRDVRNLLRVLPPHTTYDVIISEPSNPWQPGSAALFAVEFFGQLKARLSKNGVIAQWFPSYELDRDTMDVILRTYGSVFPKSRIFNAVGYDFILLSGHGVPTLDFAEATRRIGLPAVQTELRKLLKKPGSVELSKVLMHEVIGPRQFRGLWVGPTFADPLHTDRFPRIQYLAAQAFFLGRPSRYIDHVDGRREPRGRSTLLLAKRFRESPPSMKERKKLLSYWGEWPRGVGVGLSEDLAKVGRSWGDEGLPCKEAYRQETRRLVTIGTLFSEPDLKVTDALVERCGADLSPRALGRLKLAAARSQFSGGAP